jgi:hypothetical protein
VGSKRQKLTAGDEIIILDIWGRKCGNGTVQKIHQSNYHVLDLGDNTVKILKRGDIKKRLNHRSR